MPQLETLKIPQGAASGKVLTSDANGNATWQTAGGGSVTEVFIGPGTPPGAQTLWIDTDEPDPNPYAVEALRVVGAAGQPAFAAGWSHFGGGWESVGFYKDSQDRVYLQGMIKKSSAIVGGETMFTLPVGYRPVESVLMSTISNNTTGRVDVYAAGPVAPNTPSNNAWIALTGLSFRAYQ